MRHTLRVCTCMYPCCHPCCHGFFVEIEILEIPVFPAFAYSFVFGGAVYEYPPMSTLMTQLVEANGELSDSRQVDLHWRDNDPFFQISCIQRLLYCSACCWLRSNLFLLIRLLFSSFFGYTLFVPWGVLEGERYVLFNLVINVIERQLLRVVKFLEVIIRQRKQVWYTGNDTQVVEMEQALVVHVSAPKKDRRSISSFGENLIARRNGHQERQRCFG